jgi:hypothetical protein
MRFLPSHRREMYPPLIYLPKLFFPLLQVHTPRESHSDE